MRTKRPVKIPALNINKPGIPVEIRHAMIAEQIRMQYADWGMKVPRELRRHYARYKNIDSYDWECEMMRAVCLQPDDSLVERWMNSVQRGLVRAELRAELKRRRLGHKEEGEEEHEPG